MTDKKITIEVQGGMRRYHSLDKLKVLCSFLIICIHAPFPGGFGDYFTTLTRIAVPIFFMISGFFWNPMNGKKQVLKLLKLLVIANAIYFAFDLAKAIDSGIDVYIQAIFTVRNFLKFVLLNQSPFAPHLWYLGAIIYALVAFQIMEKMGLKRFLLYFIPILLLGDLILGKYSLLLLHREFPYVIVRNWLFVGIPYFGIGYVIRENREWIERKLNKLIVAGGVVAFSITSLLERYLLVAANLNTKRDHYISTTFLAIAVFLLFLYFVDNQESILAKIGREDSTWIYILHYLFISALGFAVRRVGMVDVYNIVRPVIVFVLTTALVDLMYRVKASRM